MERDDVIIMGRCIGTHDGYDILDYDTFVFYAFKPCEVLEKELPEGDLKVDFTKGTFTFYDDDGSVYKSFDAIPLITMVKREDMSDAKAS